MLQSLHQSYGSRKLSRESRYRFSGGVHNVFDARCFTRRAGGYTSPGILPAEGGYVVCRPGADSVKGDESSMSRG